MPDHLMPFLRTMVFGLCCGSVIAGPEPVPHFDVASIKRGSASKECITRVAGTQTSLTDCTVGQLVRFVWMVPRYQAVINNGPAWVTADRFSIQAKSQRPSRSNEETNARVQQLLKDRFGLMLHREKRLQRVFFLAPRASKFHLVRSQSTSCAPAGLDGRPAQGECGILRVRYLQDGQGMFIEGTAVPMSELIKVLSVMLGKEVIDSSGLPDLYDVNLRFARDSSIALTGPPVLPPAGDFSELPSIFTAIRAIGLEVKAGEAMVDILVIDGAHMPVEN